MVYLPSVRVRIAVVAVLVGGLGSACDPGPPDVSAEVAALEQYLLTADEAGHGFMLQEGGAVRGADVGHLCPDTEVSFDEFVAVRAWFTMPSDDDEVSVEQYLWTAEPDALDALMLDRQGSVPARRDEVKAMPAAAAAAPDSTVTSAH